MTKDTFSQKVPHIVQANRLHSMVQWTIDSVLVGSVGFFLLFLYLYNKFIRVHWTSSMKVHQYDYINHVGGHDDDLWQAGQMKMDGYQPVRSGHEDPMLMNSPGRMRRRTSNANHQYQQVQHVQSTEEVMGLPRPYHHHHQSPSQSLVNPESIHSKKNKPILFLNPNHLPRVTSTNLKPGLVTATSNDSLRPRNHHHIQDQKSEVQVEIPFQKQRSSSHELHHRAQAQVVVPIPEKPQNPPPPLIVPHRHSSWNATQPLVQDRPAEIQIQVAIQAKIPLFLKSPLLRQARAFEPLAHDSPESKGLEPLPKADDHGDDDHDINLHTIAFHELELGSIIGRGAFGEVRAGQWRGTAVAVKVLLLPAGPADCQSIVKDFDAEVKIMSQMRHPNICMFMGVCLDPRCLVIELVSEGSLWTVLRRLAASEDPKVASNPHLSLGFVTGTAQGMTYLHSFNPPILHRDLKSPNLLVTRAYEIKISDFGLSRVKAKLVTMTGNCGTIQVLYRLSNRSLSLRKINVSL